MPAQRVLLERDEKTGIARITLNNPERKNTYDPEMRGNVGALPRQAGDKGTGACYIRTDGVPARSGDPATGQRGAPSGPPHVAA